MLNRIVIGGLTLWLFATVALYQRAANLSARLSAAEAQIEGYQEAARVHEDYIRRLREQASEADAVGRDLQELEGRDAPLSDHLSRAAGRLWP